MFILRLRSRIVKTRARCFVRMLLFQKVEVQQQTRGGAHIALELDQLWIGIPGSYRSKERLKRIEVFAVE